MKLKIDSEGRAVLENGMPVYVYDDGKEAAINVADMAQKLSQANYEAGDRRKKLSDLENQIKAFEGIDPAAARKALDTVKNLDDKKLIDAGEVERVKSETIKAYEEKYAPVLKERDDLKNELVDEKIGGAFARSKFISEKVAIPADMLRATFGKNFKLEDGKIAAYDASGNRVFSRSNPGTPADFDEAFEIIVGQYPHRDSILKGTGSSGTGSPGGKGNGGSGNKTMTRSQFEALGHTERATTVKDGVTIVD